MSQTAVAECSPANIKRYFATVRIEEIHGFPYNYRKTFDAGALKELVDSIRQQGVIEPLILHKAETPNGIGAGFVGIAGERRHRAAQEAGLAEVPAVIFDGIERRTAIEIALVENLQRKDVNPIEEATGYRMLKEEAGMKQADIATRVGRPRSSVANTMRLLDLPEDVQEHLSAGRLTKAHGVAFLRFKGFGKLISKYAEIALREKAPAGDFEKGLPYRWQLGELVHYWASWELNGSPVTGQIVREQKEADLGRGWISDNGSLICLDRCRVKVCLAAIKEAQKKADEELEKRIQENGGVDPEEPSETEEERQAREQREAEEKEREERHQALLKRLDAWAGKFLGPKGPTRVSPLREWEGLIKFLLWDSYLFENIDHSDEALIPALFPEGTELPDEEDYEARADKVLSLPIAHLLAHIFNDLRDSAASLSSEYHLDQLEKSLSFLEGSSE